MGRTPLRACFLNTQISCPNATALTTRHRQCPDPRQHVAEQPPVQMPLGQQQPIIPGVLDLEGVKKCWDIHDGYMSRMDAGITPGGRVVLTPKRANEPWTAKHNGLSNCA